MSGIPENRLLVVENKLKIQMRSLVKPLHAAFHGPKMKAYAAKLQKEKAEKLQKEKKEKEKLKKAQKEKK